MMRRVTMGWICSRCCRRTAESSWETAQYSGEADMSAEFAAEGGRGNGKTSEQRALDLFPGGSLGESSNPPELMVVLSRGEGSAVWDAEGRRRIDFTMGWGSVLLGHACRPVTDAVVRPA